MKHLSVHTILDMKKKLSSEFLTCQKIDYAFFEGVLEFFFLSILVFNKLFNLPE